MKIHVHKCVIQFLRKFSLQCTSHLQRYSYISWRRCSERVVHSVLDGQLHISHIQLFLLGMLTVNSCIFQYGCNVPYKEMGSGSLVASYPGLSTSSFDCLQFALQKWSRIQPCILIWKPGFIFMTVSNFQSVMFQTSSGACLSPKQLFSNQFLSLDNTSSLFCIKCKIGVHIRVWLCITSRPAWRCGSYTVHAYKLQKNAK